MKNSGGLTGSIWSCCGRNPPPAEKNRWKAWWKSSGLEKRFSEISIYQPLKDRLMNENYLILVVEDDESLQKFFSDFLGLKGYRADTASTGASASEKLKSHVYDLVLIDLKLPDMNGIEIVKL